MGKNLPTQKQMSRWWFQWLIKNTPSCKETAELLSRGMESPGSLFTRIKLRLHFIICRWCRRYMAQVRFLRRAMRQHALRAESAGPALSAEARERLKQSLGSKTTRYPGSETDG